MTTRKKDGRVVVTSPPTGQDHGRRLATTPAVRTRLDPGDPAERLAFALVQAHLRRRGVKVGATERAIKARIERARVELRETPTGAEEARAVTSGLTANGGALLRTVERAAPDARDFATRAAVRFVALVREHRVESTAALVSLASAAQWSALGEMLRDECFALGVHGEGLGERLKTAAAASTAARLDLLGGLQLEREAKDARPVPAFQWSAPTSPEPSRLEPDRSPAEDETPAGDEPAEDWHDDEPPAEDEPAPEPQKTNPGFRLLDEPDPERPEAVGTGRSRAAAVVPLGAYDVFGRPIATAAAVPDEAARREAAKSGRHWNDTTKRWETRS